MSADIPAISLPDALRPADGRFGSGPSKVRPEAVAALADAAPHYLGTSHRQAGVRAVVRQLRDGLRDLLALPDGYEVVLGNGGTTAFWDVACFCLIEERSQHLVFGEFSGKFAAAVAAAPHLKEPAVIETAPGTHPEPEAGAEIDAYALTHNETSTGVMTEVRRPAGARGLVLVDATSGAGGLPVDPTQFDVYYFAPQKCFAAEGGLWAAVCSPAALERAARLRDGGRWVPASLDLTLAAENSRLDQTYNTPALSTLFLFADQVDWLNRQGGLDFAVARGRRSAGIVYGWADRSSYATPFVTDPIERSLTVATIDLEPVVEATTVSQVLRANGIVDTESYRKLGRNQLRLGMFPAVEPDDLERLTQCIDYVVERLA